MTLFFPFFFRNPGRAVPSSFSLEGQGQEGKVKDVPSFPARVLTPPLLRFPLFYSSNSTVGVQAFSFSFFFPSTPSGTQGDYLAKR